MTQPYEHYEVSPAGEEYTGQYPPQPYSAPPQQPYQAPPQPYSAPPQQHYQPAYAPAPPPVPPRRNSGLIALIASLAVLAVVAIAVVVVVVVRKDDPAPQGQGPAATTAAAPSAGRTDAQVGPVDSCLVGNWKQTQYSALFDLSSVTVGGKKMGETKLSGGGRTWKISVDGKGTEDWSGARYTGRTDDGHDVEATFTGKNEWDLKTANHEILFTSTGSTVTITVDVDGKQALNNTVEPHNNPQPYECGKNSWTAKSLTDPNANTVYDRV
ncbi:hypothetical protein ACPPVO_46585 [Dactylosporangium sp. McL0621]|uniref:hypothetical protein n=1 Tax=Dactylosporangium sp. McL0621 TaxID=3415678 RepID=UPI003CF4065B